MLADTPMKYRRNPEVMPFLETVPTTWDETVVLKAEVGDYFALARRKGDKWFLCAMTDWTPRELTVKLDFLQGGKYRLSSWEDGADARNNPTDTRISISKVEKGSTVKIKMAPGGGYAAIIEK